MSLILTSYPVTKDGADFLNGFAGFQDIDIEFKREDQQINGVTSGTDQKAKINTGDDLSGSISVGDSLYVYSEGINFNYNGSAEVLEVDGANITIDIDFIENAVGGYINYFKNWYCELKLISHINSNIDVLGYLLRDAGKPNGEVSINLNVINDKNLIEIITESGNQANSRTKLQVKFKEVYTGSLESYTLIDTSLDSSLYEAGMDATTFIPFFVVYATENFNLDEFLGEIEMPTIYKEYPAFFNLITSDANHSGEVLRMKYDELDINQNAIGVGHTDILIKTFELEDYGLEVGILDDFSGFDPNTKYVEMKGSYGAPPDFDSSDFDSSDFSTN